MPYYPNIGTYKQSMLFSYLVCSFRWNPNSIMAKLEIFSLFLILPYLNLGSKYKNIPNLRTTSTARMFLYSGKYSTVCNKRTFAVYRSFFRRNSLHSYSEWTVPQPFGFFQNFPKILGKPNWLKMWRWCHKDLPEIGGGGGRWGTMSGVGVGMGIRGNGEAKVPEGGFEIC